MSTIIPISDLKQNTASWIKYVNEHKDHVIVSRNSTPHAVIVDYDYFNALEEAVMDLTDGLEAERAKSEPTISLEDYLARRPL